MRARLKAIGYLAACGMTLGFAQARAASISEMPPALKLAAECMLKVLKTVPGVTEAKLGIVHYKGWTRPYLTYQAAERTRWIQPTRFDVIGPDDLNHGPYEFQALLPGRMSPGESPDIHVTSAVMQKWKLHCGVHAYGLWE